MVNWRDLIVTTGSFSKNALKFYQVFVGSGPCFDFFGSGIVYYLWALFLVVGPRFFRTLLISVKDLLKPEYK